MFFKNYVMVYPTSLSGDGGTGIILRPRKPTATGATDRIGQIFWRHSTDPATLQRVNEVLCGLYMYDGVLIITFLCYADNDQVCD